MAEPKLSEWVVQLDLTFETACDISEGVHLEFQIEPSLLQGFGGPHLMLFQATAHRYQAILSFIRGYKFRDARDSRYAAQLERGRPYGQS
jgi:hypothetical protein